MILKTSNLRTSLSLDHQVILISDENPFCCFLSFYFLFYVCSTISYSWISNNSWQKNNCTWRGKGISCERTTPLLKNGALRFITGYIQFPGAFGDRVKFIPARAGYQHFFLKHFFGAVDIGTGILIYPDYSYCKISYGVGLGYKFLLNKNFLQFSVAYEHTKRDAVGYFGWVNYRIAYGISFKN
ncbi:MAG: hypothetical protein EOO10_12065 [Chitinophagaceae bacterium]|nr:MAG: hypothetical protein EOO10_12065 [Chitinophagaceae bacterium]